MPLDACQLAHPQAATSTLINMHDVILQCQDFACVNVSLIWLRMMLGALEEEVVFIGTLSVTIAFHRICLLDLTYP